MALTITGWSFDQATYSPGSPMAVTVTYTSTDLQAASSLPSNLTVTVNDAAGPAVQTSDSTAPYPQFTVASAGDTPQPTTVTATDDRIGAVPWAFVSNVFAAGTAAPFTGTAVLTSVA